MSSICFLGHPARVRCVVQLALNAISASLAETLAVDEKYFRNFLGPWKTNSQQTQKHFQRIWIIGRNNAQKPALWKLLCEKEKTFRGCSVYSSSSSSVESGKSLKYCRLLSWNNCRRRSCSNCSRSMFCMKNSSVAKAFSWMVFFIPTSISTLSHKMKMEPRALSPKMETSPKTLERVVSKFAWVESAANELPTRSNSGSNRDKKLEAIA